MENILKACTLFVTTAKTALSSWAQSREIEIGNRIAAEVYYNSDCAGLELSDLENEAWIAMQAAKRKYDPDSPRCNGASLETFAGSVIEPQLREAICNMRPRWYKRRGRNPAYQDPPELVHEVIDHLEDNANNGLKMEVRSIIGRLSDLLTPRELSILLERVMVGTPHAELAKQWDLCPGRIWEIYDEALGVVRKRFKEE